MKRFQKTFVFVVAMVLILTFATSALAAYVTIPKGPVGAFVTGGTLKLRKAIDSSTVLAYMPNNSWISVYGYDYSGSVKWYKVCYNGTDGWAVAQYINLESELGTP